jgi:hypothetical protein
VGEHPRVFMYGVEQPGTELVKGIVSLESDLGTTCRTFNILVFTLTGTADCFGYHVIGHMFTVDNHTFKVEKDHLLDRLLLLDGPQKAFV